MREEAELAAQRTAASALEAVRSGAAGAKVTVEEKGLKRTVLKPFKSFRNFLLGAGARRGPRMEIEVEDATSVVNIEIPLSIQGISKSLAQQRQERKEARGQAREERAQRRREALLRASAFCKDLTALVRRSICPSPEDQARKSQKAVQRGAPLVQSDEYSAARTFNGPKFSPLPSPTSSPLRSPFSSSISSSSYYTSTSSSSLS